MNASSLAPTNSRLSLQNALADFRLILDRDQQSALSSIKSVPDADSILIFTAQLDFANRDRRGRSIGSRLYTVLSSVRNFCTVLDVIVSSHPEVAALVWGSVKLTMQIIVNYTSYFEAISELFMQLGHLCPLFAEYQALYPSSQRLQESLSSFHAALIRCCKHVIKATQRPWINQALNAMWGSFDEEFKSDMEDVARRSDHVKEAINIAKAQADAKEHELQARERDQASQGRSTVSHLFKRTNRYQDEARGWQLESELRRKRERKQHVLNALSTHDYLRPLKQSQRKRYRDTANWIFRAPEFNNWACTPDTTLLWCSGKIGSGKTITAASVIDHLFLTKSEPGAVVSFFFVRSDDQASLKAETIIRSILRQRLPSASELSDETENRIKAIGSLEELDGIVELLGDITFGRSKFYIIIDGLDECDKLERTTLLDAMASLSCRCRNIKFLLSSRDSLSEEICRHFPVLQRISTGGIGTQNDIAAYVAGIIHEKANNGDLRIGDASILGDIKEALIGGADSMFLWVFFQVQEICSQHCDEDIRKTIRNLPRGLPETFCRALRRIKAENHAKAASKVFPWIAAAIRPLSLDELREALAVEIGQRYSIPERFFNDMDRIGSWCQNLVQVDEEDHTVQFMHQTVRQFLLGNPIESDLTEFHFSLEDADHTIGEICVTYLNFSDFKRTLAPMRTPILLPSPSEIAQKAYGKHSIYALALRMKSSSTSSVQPIDIEPIINAIASPSSKATTLTHGHPFQAYASANWFPHTKHFEETKSQAWRIWKHMIINDYEIMPSSEGLASFFLNDPKGMELLERIYRIRHYGILHLISSSGNRAQYEIIQKAISVDHLSLLKLIMGIDAFGEAANQILLKAARNGDLKAVEFLIAAGYGHNTVGADTARQTALYVAAAAGNSEIANRLLTLGADGNDDNLWITYHELTVHPDWPPARVLRKVGSEILKRSLPSEDIPSADNLETDEASPGRKDAEVLP